ncbi:MAG TPA: LuxR C-terminal-related transcriptional regulator [Gemmatimonadaceae bacterium]|jgi:DNA-binding CsgD family transcriptional regulator
MTASGALARGRELIERQAWESAYALLFEEDRERVLEPDDLVRLATAAQMLGREDEATGLWSRAHTEYLARGDRRQAVRCAYWLIVPMLFRGEMALAGGWIARSQRLLEDEPAECAEHGYLSCAIALRAVRENHLPLALERFVDAVRIGSDSVDADLLAQARHGEGRALIRIGESARGAALLDEVMATVISGALSPLVAGAIYCSVLEACQEMYDVRRAQEWTDAMTTWCALQPEGLGFRGQCLVHRAELLQLHGAWSGASDEAKRARDRFLRPPTHRAIGLAYYRIAELYRLRGELMDAEEGYRQASQAGLDPQPGLALLRLAQRQPSVARTAITRALGEARETQRRARLLPAFIEISIATSDVAQARAAADELAALAAKRDAPALRATSAHASGEVMLAEGDARGALVALREAFTIWQRLDAPYDAARARVLIARACRALGDVDGAAMELASAQQTLAELGAGPDLKHAEELSRELGAGSEEDELTPRETEVLRLVATGKTNRAIAASLGISEKTIARHVSNIFMKLGLANRAAATAYAYEHGVLGRSA